MGTSSQMISKRARAIPTPTLQTYVETNGFRRMFGTAIESERYCGKLFGTANELARIFGISGRAIEFLRECGTANEFDRDLGLNIISSDPTTELERDRSYLRPFNPFAYGAVSLINRK